jgi:hypothetical protein
MTMRFMAIVKASKDSEAGVMPGADGLAAMGKYNEELVKAGVMLAADGLHPSSKGLRAASSCWTSPPASRRWCSLPSVRRRPGRASRCAKSGRAPDERWAADSLRRCG